MIQIVPFGPVKQNRSVANDLGNSTVAKKEMLEITMATHASHRVDTRFNFAHHIRFGSALRSSLDSEAESFERKIMIKRCLQLAHRGNY